MDNMEKELWDAFYGKESKQERCSVLIEAELNKHNKGTLKEGFMSDEDINNQYSNFKILDISKEGNKSGYIEVEFPNADDSDYDSYVNTGYIIYDNGTVAFDKWFPEEVYNNLVDAVKNVHENATLDEGCGKKKKKALKEDYEEDEPTRVFFVKEKNPWTEEDEITAVFPDEVNPTNGFVTCYAHIGQHSEGMLDAFLHCPEATEEEYASLLRELETVAKYDNLIVIDKPTEELDEGCGEKSEELDEILKPRHNRAGSAEMRKNARIATNIRRRIRRIRDAIQAGIDISWDDIAFLEGNQEVIKKYFPNDIELWQWANIPEDEWSAQEQSLKESDEDISGYEDRLNKTIKSEMKKFPKYAADAKKAFDDGDEIKKILNKYNQEYNFLYNNHDKVAGYEEAVRAWDEYINHPDFRELIGKVIKARHDMFTSDREIGALMFALDALGYLDKFDGKESSLEPVVKEFKMNEGITTIDVNGKRYGCYDGEHYKYDNTWDCVFREDNMNPKDYVEYSSDFLTMTFEGPFYHVMNYYSPTKYCDKLIAEFDEICKKYGKYHELGYAWSLALYDI